MELGTHCAPRPGAMELGISIPNSGPAVGDGFGCCQRGANSAWINPGLSLCRGRASIVAPSCSQRIPRHHGAPTLALADPALLPPELRFSALCCLFICRCLKGLGRLGDFNLAAGRRDGRRLPAPRQRALINSSPQPPKCSKLKTRFAFLQNGEPKKKKTTQTQPPLLSVSGGVK